MRRKRLLEKMFGHDLADALEDFGDLFKVGTADEIIDSLIKENEMENKHMSVIAYADGLTYWAYCNRNELMSKVKLAHYFDKIETLCGLGDTIHIVTQDGVCDAVVVDLRKGVKLKFFNEYKFEE